jgi:hypothetical protein
MTAPLDDPLSYPGPRPDRSWHLVDGRCSPLVGAVPTGRHAVLGIGSNACPAQLARKFDGRSGGGSQCGDDVVGLVVTVDGLTVRPSAHLGRWGYWPFAPAVSLGESLEPACPAALCLLDAAQLAVLDATEPNYVRVRLDRSAHTVTAREDVPDGPIEVYVSRHGVVDDPRLPRWTDPPPSQRALLDALIPLLPLPADLRNAEALSAALRSEPQLAAELSRELKAALRIREAGLVESPSDQRVRPSENVGSSSNSER